MDEQTKHLVASNLAIAQAVSRATIEAQKQHANLSYFTEDAILYLYQRYVAQLEEIEKNKEKEAEKNSAEKKKKNS